MMPWVVVSHRLPNDTSLPQKIGFASTNVKGISPQAHFLRLILVFTFTHIPLGGRLDRFYSVLCQMILLVTWGILTIKGARSRNFRQFQH